MTNIIKSFLQRIFPKDSKYYGIKNDCCKDENIQKAVSMHDGVFYQCQTCYRCFTLKEKNK